MSPIIARVDEVLKLKKISRQDFACQLIDYLPEKDRYLQGTGEAIRCEAVWKQQIYRWFYKNIQPRPNRAVAIENWLRDNQ